MRAAGACAIASPKAALSYTVFHGSRPKCWNTIATPGGGPVTGAPPTVSSPPVMSVRPAMQRRNVVLPQPLGPTMQRISLSRTERSSARHAVTAPSRNILLALRATIASISGMPSRVLSRIVMPDADKSSGHLLPRRALRRYQRRNDRGGSMDRLDAMAQHMWNARRARDNYANLPAALKPASIAEAYAA